MAAVPTTTDAAACADGQVAPPSCDGKPMNRLSDEQVQWILSRERQELEPDTSDFPPDEVEIMNRAKEAFDVLSDNFAELQEEVRTEYEAKGYVELDDDYIEHSEQERQSMREELSDLFDGIDLSGITFSDRYYDNFDEDENEEEDGEEDDDKDDEDNEQKGPEDAEDEELPSSTLAVMYLCYVGRWPLRAPES